MSETQLQVVNAVRYRVISSTRPHVGVAVEITIATSDGERTLPAFWMPPEAALSLAAALQTEAARGRTAN